MTALQKIVLGTPPAAVDGDPVRTASTKLNANVDVLNTQATLSSFATTLTASQTLTAAAHLGKRINISLATAGQIGLPPCNSCPADGTLLLRNLGITTVTVVVATGSGDGLNAQSSLSPGEAMLFDTDGVHTWSVSLRGRSTTSSEVVGNLAVVGNETVGGTLNVGGASTLAATTAASLSVTNNAAVTGNLTAGGTLGVTGAATFAGASTYTTAAPGYGTTAVAMSAFQKASAGKGLVTGTSARQDYPSGSTIGVLTFTAAIDQRSSWVNANTFSAPVAGVYRFRIALAVGSGPAIGTTIDVGLYSNAAAGVTARERYVTTTTGLFSIQFEHTTFIPAGGSFFFYLSTTAALYLIADASFNRMVIEQLS